MVNVLFLREMRDAAKQAGHIFPEMAACEAAIESTWGTSQLIHEARNIFGCKTHVHEVFGEISLPTKEFLGGIWKVVNAEWIVYPTYADSFKDRMNTLRTLAPHYPHYAAALAAKDPITYVLEVSKSWSTGPQRGPDCVKTYNAHLKDMQG